MRRAALRVRELMEEVGLTPFVKATGSRGLHVMAPLNRSSPVDDVRRFARELARYLAEEDSRRLTVETRKNKREGRIFVDWLRNANGQTAVAPYAVRGRPGVPVAMPLEWGEVEESSLRPDRYSMKDALKEAEGGRDPWKGWRRRAKSLNEPSRRLQRLAAEG